MRFIPDREDLGRCPTCRRHFRDPFDHPRIRVLRFERLPVPEAVDRYAPPATKKRLASRIADVENERLIDDVNITPEIAEALDTAPVQHYFDGLKALAGKVVNPRQLRPPWPSHSYFTGSHPIPGTRYFLGVSEAPESNPEQRIAEIRIKCEGINFGSGGGPTLQIHGPVARIHYDGLLVTSESRVTDLQSI